MRFVEESGGVAWGDADYELDAIPLLGSKLGDLSKTNSIFSVAFFRHGIPERDLPPDLSPKMRARMRRPTIVLFEGEGSLRSFRLRWPREGEPLEALARVCAIERRVGGEVPPWLVTACYVAGQAWQMGVMDEIRVGMAASVASALALALRGAPVAGDLDDVAIREMAQQLLLARRGDALRVPRDPWGMARMVWQISALVWSDEGAERIVEDYIGGGMPWGIASSVAPVWGVLHKPRLIEPLEDDWPSDLEEMARVVLSFWMQRIALRGATLAEAQALYTPWRVNRRWWEAPDKPPEGLPDPDLAMAMAQRLIAEAKANRQYSEQGIYDAELPPALPLVRWGVKRLRWVCLRAGYWWVSLLDEAGESLGAFRWRGEGTALKELELAMPDWIAPYVHLAVAALWRDLVVAGETVLVYAGKKGEGKGGEGAKDERAMREAVAHAERVLCLPRARKIPLHKVWPRGIESRAWGDAEDRQTLEARQRALHAVRGHYRKLAAGWRAHEAETRAANYGMPSPPDGYTFVAPHVRGGERGMDEKAMEQIRRRVRARGLESLVAALG
jgi:hypothetical protein